MGIRRPEIMCWLAGFAHVWHTWAHRFKGFQTVALLKKRPSLPIWWLGVSPLRFKLEHETVMLVMVRDSYDVMSASFHTVSQKSKCSSTTMWAHTLFVAGYLEAEQVATIPTNQLTERPEVKGMERGRQSQDEHTLSRPSYKKDRLNCWIGWRTIICRSKVIAFKFAWRLTPLSAWASVDRLKIYNIPSHQALVITLVQQHRTCAYRIWRSITTSVFTRHHKVPRCVLIDVQTPRLWNKTVSP